LSRATLFGAAVAYTAFAIYGSWVPLRFAPRPLDEAWARFQQMHWLDVGVGGRADWVANILLFVPLAFLWLGTIWPSRWSARVGVSIVVWLGACVLAVAIEFSQVFFPTRTLSLNDIVAECLGAAAGIAAWWVVGPAISTWLAGLRRVARPMGVVERVLTAYVVVVVLYALLPLDLTLSATEVYRKWKQGRLILVPFTFHEPTVSHGVYSALSEILLWVPMGIFAARRWPASPAVTIGRVALGALVLEFCQLFVFSRYADINDITWAAIGGWVGALIMRRAWLVQPAPSASARSRSAVLPLIALIVAWTAGAAVVFWYPFDFNVDREFIRGKLDRVPHVLFESYYWGSEFNAVTQVMRKMIYFMPLGALLSWCRWSIRSPLGRVSYDVGSLAYVVAAAVAIEIGQLALPLKIVDPTDAVLATCGALVGWAVIHWWTRLAGDRVP
jgi:glycopeptide antibiotics resistance protein